jgi:hypothetical protein
LVSWGIDGFESVNGDTIDLATLYFSQKHSLPIYAGSDVHGPTHEPHAWTTLLVPESDRFNQEAILKQFVTPGKTSFRFNGEGPIERSWPQRNVAWDKWASLSSIDFGYLYDETKGLSRTSKLILRNVLLHRRILSSAPFRGPLAARNMVHSLGPPRLLHFRTLSRRRNLVLGITPWSKGRKNSITAE